MTLITFQSRIHFASDVLEEALRAELEEGQQRSVLIVADTSKAEHQMMQRVHMGVPDNVDRDTIWIGEGQEKVQTANQSVLKDESGEIGAIVGCGSSRAIAHARKCRQAIAQARHGRLAKQDRRHARSRDFLPNFFAIPGVDGLPDPCMASGSAADGKTMPPNVIICDPSLLAESSPTDVAHSFAITLGRCLATFAGSSFNPLADGMAVEGLRRLSMLLPLAANTELTDGKGRDLMAASLNGSISQQKGPGLVQAIANALTALTNEDVDVASLQRILLPRLIEKMNLITGHDEALVMRVLDGRVQVPLFEHIEGLLDPLPLNRTLRELGHDLEDYTQAVADAQSRVHFPDATASRLNTIVQEAY